MNFIKSFMVKIKLSKSNHSFQNFIEFKRLQTKVRKTIKGKIGGKFIAQKEGKQN